MHERTGATELRLSVVIPAHNEADNLPGLVDEVLAAFGGARDIEILVVDDASTDATPAVLAELQARVPQLRVLRHVRNAGQSTALINGVRAARASWVGTLDGDGQNDPADLPRLLAHVRQRGDPALKLVQGWRTGRKDGWIKRISSRIANGVRGALLRDATPDSGCGIRVVEREALLRAPAFDHMHRFIPALIRQQGWKVESLAVNHRPRTAGRSHYGTLDRLWVGIIDLVGVAWLGRRTRCTEVNESRPS
ncbi:MAG: dolichol-phosphate mannosyltransferase [Lysobacteraceae bacterium]|nr:MAG: dolichol-phosphate mannosyltransferase [Xanthomonadaceae bacterium]